MRLRTPLIRIFITVTIETHESKHEDTDEETESDFTQFQLKTLLYLNNDADGLFLRTLPMMLQLSAVVTHSTMDSEMYLIP